MTAFFFVAGFPVAPIVAAIYGQIGRVAAAGSVAEAFSWFATSISIGIAGGSVAGGWLIDTNDWRAGIVFGVALVALGAIVVTVRRGTLAPPLSIGAAPE
jgi:predicted MFS family arabinose efflux permease